LGYILGDFFAYGATFYFRKLTITEVAQMLGLLSSAEKVVFRLQQKMVWATFWATFSPMGQLFTLGN
jgi:hypothetical protein